LPPGVIGVRVGLRSYGVHHPGVLLTAEIVIGVLVYVPLALVVCRQQSRDLLNVAREMLSRRSVSEQLLPPRASDVRQVCARIVRARGTAAAHPPSRREAV